MKRKIARTSLQRSVTNQILTFKAEEEVCKENIVVRTFFSIYKKDMVQVTEVLDARYLLGNTVPGTRSFILLSHQPPHQLRENNSVMNMYTIKDHFFSALPTGSDIALTLKPNDYAAYIFGGFWWLVLVDSINLEEKDKTHGSSCIPMVQFSIFVGSVLMIWDMYPLISSL